MADSQSAWPAWSWWSWWSRLGLVVPAPHSFWIFDWSASSCSWSVVTTVGPLLRQRLPAQAMIVVLVPPVPPVPRVATATGRC